MINFQGIEFAYKQVCKDSYAERLSRADMASMVGLHNQLTIMINCMKLANVIVIKAQRYVSELNVHWFNIEFDDGFTAAHIKVAALALQMKYGNITLTPQNENDYEEYESVKVDWKAKMQFPMAHDHQMHRDCRLFGAVLDSSTSAINRLLGEGANPNAKGPFGRTPVYAVMRNPDHIRILGEAGAKRDVSDKFGLRPYDVAAAFDPESQFARNIFAYLK